MCLKGAWLMGAATIAFACSASSGLTAYDNTTNSTGSIASLAGNQWADDLHMSQATDINEVIFGYDSNGTATSNGATQAKISFYANDASNSIWPGGGAAMLAQYTVALDPQASGFYALTLDDDLPLPKDVWFAISFNHFNGSVLLYDPPTVGSSFDVLVRSTSSSFWNGSAPAAYFPAGENNFAVRIGYLEAPAPGAAASLLGASGLLMGVRPRRRR